VKVIIYLYYINILYYYVIYKNPQIFFTLSTKVLSCALFSTLTIRNISGAPNSHITIISEGACDTEELRQLKMYRNDLYFKIH